MKDPMTALLIVFVLGVAVIFFLRPSRAVEEGDTITGTVRYVVDGDSLYIEGVEPQIRLWGIDAPEKDEEGYKAATDALTRLAKGKRIICQKMDIDRYGRIVGRCRLKNGQDISAAMIKGGYAREYCRYSKGFYGTCNGGN